MTVLDSSRFRPYFIPLWTAFSLLTLGVCYRRLWRVFEGDYSLVRDLQTDGFLSTGFFLWLFLGLAVLSVVTLYSSRSTVGAWLRHKGAILIGLGSLAIAGTSVMALAPFIQVEVPHFSEAIARNTRALIGSAEVFLAVFTLGRLALTPFRNLFKSRLEKLLYTIGIGALALALGSLGIALLGEFQPSLMVWIIHGLALAGSALVMSSAYRRWMTRAKGEYGRSRRDKAEPGAIGWKSISIIAVLIGFAGALAPEVEYDALWYHLWLPKLWLEAGHPVDLVHEYVSLYPMNLDLLFGAGLVMGGPISAKLLHYGFFVLTAMLIYLTVRRTSRKGMSWMGVALFLTAPTVLWEATTAYVDVGLGFFVTLSAYALLRYAEESDARWLILAALMTGFSLGVKHLALLVLCGEILCLVLWGWHKRMGSRKTLGIVLAFVLISTLLASPWYIRSLVASGNPVFPDLYSIFGAQPPERWSPITEEGLRGFKDKFGVDRTVGNMLLLPWIVTTEASKFSAAFGPLFLICLVPLLAWRRWTPPIVGLSVIAGVYVIMWASPLSSFQGRFLVPIVPILAVLAANGFAEVVQVLRESRQRVLRAVIVPLIAFVMILNLPPFISLHEGDRRGLDGWLTHVLRQVPEGVVLGIVDEQRYLEANVRSYSTWQFINKTYPDTIRVLTFSGGDHFYSDRDRLWSESTMAFPAVRGSVGKDDNGTLEALRALRVTHVLFDNERLARDRALGLPLARACDPESWCPPTFESKWYTVCEIRRDKILP